MSKNENGSKGVRLWRVAGSAVFAMGLVALVRTMPDIVRYMRIRSM